MSGMATIEVHTLDGRVTKVAKDPREYFAEWRAMVAEGRERREQAREARLERRTVSDGSRAA